MARKRRKAFLRGLKTRFQLIVRNEENFAEKVTFKFTYLKIVGILGLTFLSLAGISFILVTTLFAKWFDPRVEFMQADRQLITLEQKVDSLSNLVFVKDQFLQNLVNRLNGKSDSLENIENEPINKGALTDIDVNKVDPIDSIFREQFDDFNLGSAHLTNINLNRKEALQDLFLFPPINGVVSKKFNALEEHFGTDIVANKEEPIKSIADGTVIFSSWTQDGGYVLGVQHKGDLLSVYKHNSIVLKSVGEFVSAGDMIAIIGNSGELTDGPHLHFELWYNGLPVNAEDFIVFN